MKGRRLTLVLAVLTLVVLALSLPGSLRDVYERGGLYLFSRAFLEDIPKRLLGPGRFRFLLQPAMAVALGVRAGRSDARTGRPHYIGVLLFEGTARGALLRSSVSSVANLLLMGVLLDAVTQWLILGVSHPGAALVVGPLLIAIPYAAARELASRVTSRARIVTPTPRTP